MPQAKEIQSVKEKTTHSVTSMRVGRMKETLMFSSMDFFSSSASA